MVWLHPILVLYIFLLSVSFFVGLAISIVSLYAAWAMGAKLKKNNALCCLMIALATSLWVVMLSQLFDPYQKLEVIRHPHFAQIEVQTLLMDLQMLRLKGME